MGGQRVDPARSRDIGSEIMGSLNRFFNGRPTETSLGGNTNVLPSEQAYMKTEPYQQGIRNMYMNDQFKWGGVDREWQGISRADMAKAGVSEQDLMRQSMSQSPQGSYKYEGSNQAQIDNATATRNAAFGGGDAFYIPVAQGKVDALNQFLAQRKQAKAGQKTGGGGYSQYGHLTGR